MSQVRREDSLPPASVFVKDPVWQTGLSYRTTLVSLFSVQKTTASTKTTTNRKTIEIDYSIFRLFYHVCVIIFSDSVGLPL